MTKKTVGIGIVGTGFGAIVQLPGFLQVKDARVMGIVSREPEKTKELTRKHGLPTVYGSWQEMIADPEIDLLSVTTPPFAHEEIVHAAIEAGKHVLCEKPFTRNATSAKKLLSEAEAAGIVHAIDFEFRDLEVMQALHREVTKMKDIKKASLSWRVGTWADPNRPWKWQCDRAQEGGVLGALGVHLFDAAQWLFGPAAKAQADTRVIIKQRTDGQGAMKEVTGEDYSSVDMTMESGLGVNALVTNVEKDGNGLSIIVEGADKTLRLVSAEQDYGRGLRLESVVDGTVTILAEEKEPPEGTDARIPPFVRFASRLVKAVQEGDTSFRPSFEDGVRAQAIRDIALQTDQNGRWLDIA